MLNITPDELSRLVVISQYLRTAVIYIDLEYPAPSPGHINTSHGAYEPNRKKEKKKKKEKIKDTDRSVVSVSSAVTKNPSSNGRCRLRTRYNSQRNEEGF